MDTAPPAADTAGSSSLPASPRDGAALTLKQQAAYDLKVQGKTRAEIAHILGISESVVSKTLQACYRKLGIKKKAGGQEGPGRGLEITNPERAAAIVDALSDPLHKVQEALKLAGLPEKVSQSVLKRLRVKFYGAIHEVKALKTNEIVQMCEEKLDMIRFYLDDKVMAEASARDLGLMAGVLIEKRQLVRGEPTQIISDYERKKLHELMPAMIEEAKRRGAVTVDGETGEVVESR